MSRRAKHLLGALAILMILGSAYIAKFGLYPQFFDIAWDEEVQLHDGRVIVVQIKRLYQRKGMGLERYPQDPYRLGMVFSFEPGLNGSKFTHYFKKGGLNFIDHFDGKWYIGYYADEGDLSSELGSRKIYPHVAILNSDGTITKPDSWGEVPEQIKEANVMPSTPDEKVISKFIGARLTVAAKMQHWAQFPTGAGEHRINRITPQSASQGDKK